MSGLTILKPDGITFEPAEHGRLNARLADGTVVKDVHGVMLFPFSEPNRYVSIVTRDKGEIKELGVVADLEAFGREQVAILRAAVGNRYFLPEILEVRKIIEAYGLHEWDVRTDRGDKIFFVHEVKDSITTDETGTILITDIEKCRYRITDLKTLPPASRARVERVLL